MAAVESCVERRLAPKNGSLDVLADRIAELRALFAAEYAENRELYDKRDHERFMDARDDWYARRWIMYQRDVGAAFEMVRDTMRWRQEIGLNSLSYEDFPREFFECGCIFEYGTDQRGRRVVYIRCSLFRPANELSALYDRYFAFMMDQCDKRSKAKGFTLVFDVSEAGVTNVEMSTLKFMTSLRDRFPYSGRQVLVAGLPWVLKPVFSLVMSLLPASHAAAFKLINLDELNQFIDDNQIPTALGGASKTKFQLIPSQAKGAEEFQQLSPSIVDKLKKHVASKTDPNDYELVKSLRVIR